MYLQWKASTHQSNFLSYPMSYNSVYLYLYNASSQYVGNVHNDCREFVLSWLEVDRDIHKISDAGIKAFECPHRKH